MEEVDPGKGCLATNLECLCGSQDNIYNIACCTLYQCTDENEGIDYIKSICKNDSFVYPSLAQCKAGVRPFGPATDSTPEVTSVVSDSTSTEASSSEAQSTEMGTSIIQDESTVTQVVTSESQSIVIGTTRSAVESTSTIISTSSGTIISITTPLEQESQTSPPSKPPSSSSSSSNTPGLGVGLGIGLPLFLVGAAYIAFLVWKTKRQPRIPDPSHGAAELDPGSQINEMDASGEKKAEMAGDGPFGYVPPVERHELPVHERYELPSSKGWR